MAYEVPPLWQRVKPLFLFGAAVGALRLALDFWDREVAMWVGLYYLMPLAILWVGLKRKWGLIGWRRMAGTMFVVSLVTFGLWTAIAYTVGQFMEWTDGRYYPGERTVLDDGTVAWVGGRTAPVADTALGKVGAGLLHGVITTVTGGVWCTVFGTVFIWVIKRPTAVEPSPSA